MTGPTETVQLVLQLRPRREIVACAYAAVAGWDPDTGLGSPRDGAADQPPRLLWSATDRSCRTAPPDCGHVARPGPPTGMRWLR